MRAVTVSLAVWVLTFAPIRAMDPPPTTIRIDGDIAKPADWTAARIGEVFAKDVKTIQYPGKESVVKGRAIPLLTFVKATEPKVDPKRKNHQLAFAIVAKASDGYAVAFGLGELMDDFGQREVYLVFDGDGKSLPERDRPVRLVVLGDTRPARSVYGIRSITVLDATKPTKERHPIGK